MSDYGRLFGRFDVESYFENENRKVLNTFNFRIFELLEQNQVFRDEEIRKLYDREREFELRMKSLPKIARQKEMERLLKPPETVQQISDIKFGTPYLFRAEPQ